MAFHMRLSVIPAWLKFPPGNKNLTGSLRIMSSVDRLVSYHTVVKFRAHGHPLYRKGEWFV